MEEKKRDEQGKKPRRASQRERNGHLVSSIIIIQIIHHSKSIILSMQKDLLPPALPSPNIPLHRPHSPRDIRPHPRRPADKDRRARSRPALAAQLAQHERDVRTTPLGGPARRSGFARESGGHESEAHEVLLELGRSRWETEVGVLGFLLVVLLDLVWVVWCVCVGRWGDSLEGVEGGVLCGGDVEAEGAGATFFMEGGMGWEVRRFLRGES